MPEGRDATHDRWCVGQHDDAGKCLNVYQPGRETTRSAGGDMGEREWSYMDRQTGLTGDDVDEQGRLTYTTESTPKPDHTAKVTGSMAESVATCPTCGIVARGSRQHCRNLAYQHPWPFA